MNKPIKPEFSTTVEPWEYDIDAQMEHFVKAANKEHAMFFSIDVGKLWGLYQSWKAAQDIIKMNSFSSIFDNERGGTYMRCNSCHGDNATPGRNNYKVEEVKHESNCRVARVLGVQEES